MARNTAQITANDFSDHDLLPIGSSENFDDDGSPKRAGTVWTATAYIVTAVTGPVVVTMGPVVLTFASYMAQLGWIAGPFVIILSSFITYFASTILCASYRSPVTGKRNPTYMHAIRSNFENGKIKGSLTGMGIGPQVTRAQKTWMIFTAIGDIAQAYDFSSVLLEIQDTVGSTVGSSSSEVQKMKKATRRSVAVITFIFMIHGCIGYAAFGESSPEFLTDSFYKPNWLLDIASAAMVIQAAGGYQIFAQPIFAMVEKSISTRFPVITEEIKIWIPRFGPYKLDLFRLVWRTLFVIVITLLSMFFAICSDVLKLVGIMAFWPIVIYFPVEMYIVQKEIPKWSGRWLCLQILGFWCLIVTIAAVAGHVVETFLRGSYNPKMPNRY
ncbi:hypothetical protein I3760_16G024800 [Carya illinoinensis]|nr:hypothetical protein I3760_16G024800 [Carya illinoinensis]KAG2663356.1 hypothetical protein I3760_16G024800 [Carya illinoinensis]